ncbi:hypothetical protein BGZ80_001971, partial [Entomortierella chlamydospora]
MSYSIKTFWGISCSGPFEEPGFGGNAGDTWANYCTEGQDECYSSAYVWGYPRRAHCNYMTFVSGYERSSEFDCATRVTTNDIGNSCFRTTSCAENFGIRQLSFCCQGPKCHYRDSDGLPGYFDSSEGYVYLYDGQTKYPTDLGGLTHREFASKHGRK